MKFNSKGVYIMLTITLNSPVVIRYARKGVHEDKGPWSLVTIYENDNSDSKSKSYIKAWGTDLDSEIKDGSKVLLTSFNEVRLVHEKYGEKFGQPLFHDVYEIRGAVFEPYKG